MRNAANITAIRHLRKNSLPVVGLTSLESRISSLLSANFSLNADVSLFCLSAERPSFEVNSTVMLLSPVLMFSPAPTLALRPSVSEITFSTSFVLRSPS